MFVSWNRITLILAVLTLMLVGCEGGTYSNPTSPPTTPSEWRSVTITDQGGSFSFSDIGVYINFPAGVIPDGEVHSFNVRLNPDGVPMIPTGPVYYRLGTFELTGTTTEFLEPVEVRWRIVENKREGLTTEAFWLNDDRKWEWSQVAVVSPDGWYVNAFIPHTGIYGSFLRVPLHVELTASRTSGPVPLSVGMKAIVTGGHPPYSVLWTFGDNEDPEMGLTWSHIYVDPGTYTITCMVKDQAETEVTDWIFVTAYYQSGPHAIP
ncbi:MAG TPA: PKD domain-containing protein [Firmicutes bacterium]|nr:PKD domain-containing protein [Bacillota bacterium]